MNSVLFDLKIVVDAYMADLHAKLETEESSSIPSSPPHKTSFANFIWTYRGEVDTREWFPNDESDRREDMIMKQQRR